MKDPLGKLLLRWRIAAVLPHVRGRLLDVGCGTNQLVRRYPGEGVGVDVYPWPGVDQVVADSARLPFADATFDTVAIIAALNHIPNRAAVLQEVCRVLRPGGRVLTTMIPPLISRAWHALRAPWDADQHERGMQPGEVYGLRRDAVSTLLTRAGFVICCERRFMLGVNRLTVAQRPTDPVTATRSVSASH